MSDPEPGSSFSSLDSLFKPDSDKLRAILDVANPSAALAALDAQLKQSLLPKFDFSSLFPLPSTAYFSSLGLDLSETIRSAFVHKDLIETITAPLREIQEQFVSSLGQVTASLGDLYKPVLADLAAGNYAFSSLASSTVFEGLRRELEEDKDTVHAFNEAGWPIAPSMTPDLRREIRSLRSVKRLRYASGRIIAFYHRNKHAALTSAVEGWPDNSLFSPRMHILRDALAAHRERRYTLSVPALFPQIEGILIDYVTKNRIDAKLGSIKDVYEKVIGDPLKYDMSSWVVATTLLYQLQTSTYLFSDFKTEVTKSFTTRAITRHTVLHGIATRYNRASNSLRAFLLLDALSALKDAPQIELA